jgi:hypothetical protein
MQSLTATGNGSLGSISYAFRGAVCGPGVTAATITDTAARTVVALGTASMSIALDGPIMVTGLVIAGFAGAGTVTVFVE